MAESPPGVGHTDSIESHDSNGKATDKKKTRRPANTAFRQQRLKAWQPILTPKTVLPLFFSIGIIFAPIGGLLLYASAQVQEIRINYTNCFKDAPIDNFVAMPSDNVFRAFKSSNASAPVMWRRKPDEVIKFNNVNYTTTMCEVQFTIPEDMGPPVLFYYQLTNFYQNHRRYVASFFDRQLKGEALGGGAVNGSACTPLTYDEVTLKPLYPCGLIANSMFNDTFSSPFLIGSNADQQVYEMSNSSNIAWASDADLYGNTAYNISEIMPPPNWRKRYPEGYTDGNRPPDLATWQAFQVWMRTAGLPVFSKLYQRNDLRALTPGTYQVNIEHNFPTEVYKGTKSIIITTRTVMGGRNPFLGIAYVVVGGICIVLGAIFTVTHLIKPRKLGDHTYLSWNNAPGSSTKQTGGNTAVASGREMRPGDVA